MFYASFLQMISIINVVQLLGASLYDELMIPIERSNLKYRKIHVGNHENRPQTPPDPPGTHFRPPNHPNRHQTGYRVYVFFYKKNHILDIRFGDDWSGLGVGNGFLVGSGVFGDDLHGYPRGFYDISYLKASSVKRDNSRKSWIFACLEFPKFDQGVSGAINRRANTSNMLTNDPRTNFSKFGF